MIITAAAKAARTLDASRCIMKVGMISATRASIHDFQIRLVIGVIGRDREVARPSELAVRNTTAIGADRLIVPTSLDPLGASRTLRVSMCANSLEIPLLDLQMQSKLLLKKG